MALWEACVISGKGPNRPEKFLATSKSLQNVGIFWLKHTRTLGPGYIAPEPRPKRLGFSAMPCSHASDESDSARRERHPARLEAFLRAVEQNPKILEEA